MMVCLCAALSYILINNKSGSLPPTSVQDVSWNVRTEEEVVLGKISSLTPETPLMETSLSVYHQICRFQQRDQQEHLLRYQEFWFP